MIVDAGECVAEVDSCPAAMLDASHSIRLFSARAGQITGVERGRRSRPVNIGYHSDPRQQGSTPVPTMGPVELTAVRPGVIARWGARAGCYRVCACCAGTQCLIELACRVAPRVRPAGGKGRSGW